MLPIIERIVNSDLVKLLTCVSVIQLILRDNLKPSDVIGQSQVTAKVADA